MTRIRPPALKLPVLEMSEDDYQFDSKVDTHDFGRMAYTVVYVPGDLIRQLPLKDNPRLRIDGTVAGVPFHGAFQPAGDGRYYLMLSKSFLKAARLRVDDVVNVVFRIADQNAVNVPRELEFALNANDRARRIWDSISAGKKRGFAHRVSSAKRSETRENRVDEVIESLYEIETS